MSVIARYGVVLHQREDRCVPRRNPPRTQAPTAARRSSRSGPSSRRARRATTSNEPDERPGRAAAGQHQPGGDSEREHRPSTRAVRRGRAVRPRWRAARRSSTEPPSPRRALRSRAGTERTGREGQPLRVGLGDRRDRECRASAHGQRKEKHVQQAQSEKGRGAGGRRAEEPTRRQIRARTALRVSTSVARRRGRPLDVGTAHVDRPEAFRRLLTDPPDVRLSHPRDGVSCKGRVPRQLCEAKQVIRLVGPAQRRRDRGIEQREARRR